MTAIVVPAGMRPRRIVRNWWWRHPEAPFAALAGLAALILVVDHLRLHDHSPGHVHLTSLQSVTAWSFDPAHWTLMIVAMMLPGALPTVRQISFDSLWGRRHANAALFAAGYIAVWVGAGLAAALAVAAFERASGRVFAPSREAVAIAFFVAAAWQFAPARLRALRRCHRRMPFAPRGWKANRDLVRYGVVNARACFGACGVAMGAMFVAGHDLHLMVPLAMVMVVDRLRGRPAPAAGAAVIAAIGLFTFLGL